MLTIQEAKRFSPKMDRKELYPIELVLEKVLDNISKRDGKTQKVDFDGDPINMASNRYKTFKHKGIVCVECGITGQYFAKEKWGNSDSFHFNLYAVDIDGNEVLMTKDHIEAKSKGGSGNLDNFQTMCLPCNMAKGTGDGNERPES